MVESAAGLSCDLEGSQLFNLCLDEHPMLSIRLPHPASEDLGCRFDRTAKTLTVTCPLLNPASTEDPLEPHQGEPEPQGRPQVFLEFEFGAERERGRVVIELFNDLCPKTCQNFLSLCTGDCGIGEKGLPLCYKGSRVHHIFPTWVLEAGSLDDAAVTGDSIYGAEFSDDAVGGSRAGPGTVSMCSRAGKMSSMFYVELRHCDHLDGKNIVFGRVVAGMEVVRAIENQEREARPPDPATTFIVRETDNAVIHPVHPVSICDCGKLDECEKVSTEQSKAVDGDSWPDFPQDSRCDGPAQLLNAASQIQRCGQKAFELAEFVESLNKLDKSVRYIQRAQGCTDVSEQLVSTLLDRIKCLDATGKHTAVVDDCDHILGINPNHQEALYWRGSALLQSRTYQDLSSIECLNQAADSLERAVQIGGAKSQESVDTLKQVRKSIKQQKKSEKSVYAKMFG